MSINTAYNMAYRAVVRLSRNQQSSTYGRINITSAFLSEQLPAISQQRKYHNGQNGNHGGHQEYNSKWSQRFKVGVGFGIAATAIVAGLPAHALLAEEHQDKKLTDKEQSQLFKVGGGLEKAATAIAAGLQGHSLLAEEIQDITEKETRVRRTQTLDKIFDYFATYRYINDKGKNVNLMSIKDFYNAVTPGSTITHGTGLISEADYSKVTDSDINSDKLYQKEELPVPNSILNKIQKEGLLSYTDFCFLMNILATPRRYLDIAFLAFDITADGKIEAKEYLKVLSKITKHTGGLARFDDCGTPDELMKARYSGVMNYLFGKDRSKKVAKEAFLKLRGQIIDDILWLEFTRYCKALPDLPNIPPQKFPIITDVEFCEHLLSHANIPIKKKKAMIKRVTKFFGESSNNPTQLGEAITFDMFKSFYLLLFCGADLERSLFFHDIEKGGVSRAEFVALSKFISDMEVDAHIVDVIFLLLDDDEDKVLSTEEFGPLLAEWRHSRAFMQASTSGATIIDVTLA